MSTSSIMKRTCVHFTASTYAYCMHQILYIVIPVQSRKHMGYPLTTIALCHSKTLGCIHCHLSIYIYINKSQHFFRYSLLQLWPQYVPICATRGIVRHSKEPISLQGIFIYGSRDIKSHLERQEMDRILNSGILCNACRLLQVANFTHGLAHAQAEIFAWGHISLGDGDKVHVANNWRHKVLPR